MTLDGVLQSEKRNFVRLVKMEDGKWLIGGLMDMLRFADGRTPLDHKRQ